MSTSTFSTFLVQLPILLLLSTSFFLPIIESTGHVRRFDHMDQLLLRASRNQRQDHAVVEESYDSTHHEAASTYSPVYIGDQAGLMEADKIDKLPGQPEGVDFDQYAGYVTVDPKAGRALFYYFTQAPKEPENKLPLVLWLNGGPGCSSFGDGAMMELGPFRVKSDGMTLSRNPYAWNNVANIIFLESPAGVGYSYSNTSSDYDLSGDKRTAQDSYVFLMNWLERFPQYKSRDFYIAGESYAGHYVPQLSHKILVNNKMTNQTVINLRGIVIGNALIDRDTTFKGTWDFYWSHSLISDEVHAGISLNCDISSTRKVSDLCEAYIVRATESIRDIFPYDIYAPWCNASSPTLTMGGFDPCSDNYIDSYLNLQQVQVALHANLTSLPYPWTSCSGDTDGRLPVTSSRYSINALNLSTIVPWYSWYTEGEVGGYAVGYENLTFVTVRGSGHFVPSYQPARALILFTSFLKGRLPPSY